MQTSQDDLNDFERELLATMLENNLATEKSREHQKRITSRIAALRSGYSAEYGLNVAKQRTWAECQEVKNILNMFETLKRSIEYRTDEQKSIWSEKDQQNVQSFSVFHGFGTDENERWMSDYSRFLIDQGYSQEIKAEVENELLLIQLTNSRLENYRRMLEKFRIHRPLTYQYLLPESIALIVDPNATDEEVAREFESARLKRIEEDK